MPFKMRQIDHKIVIGKMRADQIFFEVFTTHNRKAHRTICIHNINRCNGCKAMFFHHTQMRCSISTAATICRVTFHDSTFDLSLIHISKPTRLLSISYAVFCLKKKKKTQIVLQS